MPELTCNCERSAHLVKVIRETGGEFETALGLVLRSRTLNADDRGLLEKMLAVAQNFKECPL